MSSAFAPLNEDELVEPQPIDRTANPRQSVLPIPVHAPPLTRATIDRFAPEGHAFTAEWRYLDSSGQLLGCVVRYDRPANGDEAGKQVKPFTYCEGPSGRREWRCKAFPEPRPLYGLDRIAARPDAPVLVVEGEKAADAVAERFPAYVAVTSPGGCKVAAKADWSPLSGRLVVIWPDADDAGKGYASDVADVLRKVGAGSVSVANVASVAGLPQGWDLHLPVRQGDPARALRLPPLA